MPHRSLGYPWGAFASGVEAIGVWRSLVARFVRDEEVAGSNPVAPTIRDTGPWCNGSTEDSGSFSRGSSPCGPATREMEAVCHLVIEA